ncbi:MAG TPA: PASTA domain-containing protein [Oscillospiraceae bacterium]|nr:PASTA domain-containing protein [Oscillospiraceae bacterium]
MTGFDNLCMNCMSDTGGEDICSNCGFRAAEPQMFHALPYRTVLQERYIVGKAKKSNGEGISYIGYDTVLNITIELREFFPQTICERAENATDIRVVSGSEIIFNDCLSSFLSYSREIAHMRELSSIVQVYDIFEENHTAYTVSEWNESITLRYFVERSGGNINWNAARQLFMPVLSALSSIHANKVNHLGISPDTLFIMKDGKMKLGGFCIGEVRRMDTDLPPDMTAGCAAIEQYVMDYIPNEATDVYGFAATLFFALTGDLPQDALKRRTDSRLLIPTSILRNIPPHVVTALANALQVSPDKRTATFERLRAELSAAPTVTASIDETLQSIPQMPVQNRYEEPEKTKKGVPNFVWGIVSCVIALVVFGGILAIYMAYNNSSAAASSSSVASSESTSAVDSVESSLTSSSSDSAVANQITAPNLVGKSYAGLMSASSNPDYEILLSKKDFSDTVKEGDIISQSPSAGETMSKGSPITVVVSKGKAIQQLPDIANKSLADASLAVTNAGFTPSQAYDFSDTVSPGNVIGYKDAKAGDKMNSGSQVTIVVSKGPNPSTATGSAPQQ